MDNVEHNKEVTLTEKSGAVLNQDTQKLDGCASFGTDEWNKKMEQVYQDIEESCDRLMATNENSSDKDRLMNVDYLLTKMNNRRLRDIENRISKLEKILGDKA